jgi:chromosome partitioning protein
LTAGLGKGYGEDRSNRRKDPDSALTQIDQPMITAITSQKGGTGKTTTAIALSAGLAQQGKRVLLIDTDSQANSSKVLLPDYARLQPDQTLYRTILERQPLSIHKTAVPQLDIVPAHILLSNTDLELTSARDHREARLRQQLEAVQARYDYLFIDCPPALSWLTINALTAAEQALVVVSPGYFELDSIVQLTKTVKEVQEFFNARLRILGFLFTMSEPTINTRTSLQLMRQAYGESVLNTVIPKNVDVKDAHMHQQDLFSYNPNSKAALAYKKLIQELFDL